MSKVPPESLMHSFTITLMSFWLPLWPAAIASLIASRMTTRTIVDAYLRTFPSRPKAQHLSVQTLLNHGCRKAEMQARPHALRAAAGRRIGEADGERLRRPLLERRHPEGRAGDLYALRAQDLRGTRAGADRHRSLRAVLSGRRKAGGGSGQDLSQLVRRARVCGDRADPAAVRGRARGRPA